MSTNNKQLSRRQFVRMSGLTGAALTIGFYLPSFGKEGSVEFLTGENASAAGIDLTAWISIDKNGKVTLINHRSEMGQGSFQSVPQIIAEELEVRMEDINVVFAQGHPSKYGSQVTGGSSTVRGSYKALLLTGATAREMLMEAAAKKGGVAKSECYAENGQVIHRPSGRKMGYGDLVEDAAKLEIPKEVPLKQRKDYKLIGKPLPRIDNTVKILGTAEFGLDKTLPGMLHATVERSPRFHGKVKSFDATAAKAVPGVKDVFKVSMPVFGFTREGVAVVATSTWAALQGRKALKVTWDDTGIEILSTDALYKRMRADLDKPGNSVRTAGNFADNFLTA
ncbi:MAG TPA: molybdopterin cofactor-binding domain-containing protein, partial [Phnomibacter sp.]|nr:molybdopterin cofactor-binding domain-containing protein [Phnomibacter sp.]